MEWDSVNISQKGNINKLYMTVFFLYIFFFPEKILRMQGTGEIMTCLLEINIKITIPKKTFNSFVAIVAPYLNDE